jgi:hypothetical protein
MSEIFIQSNAGQIGPFSESHVRDSIAMGSLSSQAMSWRQGSADWVPLYILLNLDVPQGGDVLPKKKERHGCLTVFLVLMIILSAWSAIGASASLFLSDNHSSSSSATNLPSWYAVTTLLGSVINLLCAIVLITWKKWGFWGYLISNLTVGFLAIFIQGIGFSVMLVSILSGLLMSGLLYAALQMGDKEQGWRKLS